MKHIAMLIPTIDQIGGAERQVLLLAKALAARDWRVTIIALSGSGQDEAKALAESNVDYLSLEMRKAWIDPRGWMRYLAWHRQHRPEIVHTHLPHATWFARWIRLLAPVRVLMDTIHTSKIGRSLWRLGYQFSSPLTTHITCVSEAVANSAWHAAIVTKNKLSVLFNGIHLPPESRQPDHQGFHWIAIGRLAPVKDYPTLFRAFAELPSTARLTIAGSGPEELRLKEVAANLGIGERVNFAGFQSNIEPLLANSDAFVLSSLWEGLPISILEAQSAGLPVVATDGAGTREALINNQTGLLVPVGDSTALAAAMTTIMNMPSHDRQAMGASGRKFVAEHFAITVITNNWEHLYRQLLQANPRPSRHG
jgi:glycosyltransferase involved in cell wall biosynthesis